MANPFKPALARAAARGLRVIEGEADAAARARALRASAARRTQPEYTLLEGPQSPHEEAMGVTHERTFRGVAPAVEADAATQMAREAAARHARQRGVKFSPSATAKQQAGLDELTARNDLNRDFRRAVEDDARRRALERSRGYGDLAHSGLPPKQDVLGRSLLDAFEDRFGWRPRTEEEARALMSPEHYRELGFPVPEE